MQQLLGTLDLGSVFDADLSIEATHLDAADEAIAGILDEVFPDTATTETIALWEDMLGIDPVSGASLAIRRTAALAKLRAVGGLSVTYFEGLAEGLGYNIGLPAAGDPHLRIVEGAFVPFKADISKADVGIIYDQVTGYSWATWQVYGTDVETDDNLQAIFNAFKPAWSEVQYINE